MIVTYLEKHKVFVAHTTPPDKDVVKAAGFLWDPDGKFPGGRKVWKTRFASRAMRLYDYCDDKARAALDIMKLNLEQSRATDAAIEIPSPDGLEYLPYQKAGIAYALRRKGTLIGDEMGLGKTVQALGFINAKQDDVKKVVIVCPASLRINWKREAQRWLIRNTNIQILRGNEVPIREHVPTSTVKIYICGFNYLDTGHLDNSHPDLLIVDEAHYCKNPKTNRTKNILGTPERIIEGTKEKPIRTETVQGIALRSKYRLFLTGTPLPNKPLELHPLAAHLSPANFGHFMRFAKRYCGAHQERHAGRSVWVFDGASHLDELQDKLRASIMIRRLKGDVLAELPPKRRSVIPVEAQWNEPNEVEDYLKVLNSLDPANDDANTITAVDKYNEDIKNLRYTRPVAFEKMASYRRAIGEAKVPGAIDYIKNMLACGVDKVIVFAHHREVIEALFTGLKKFKPVKILGGVSDKNRQKAVDSFQNDPETRVFIGGILAAGVGLTLTAAHHVVTVESDWVPATNTQAEDRAHRIGQRDIVFAHQLVIDDTLDAYMAKKVIRKQEIADAALDTIHQPIKASSKSTSSHQNPIAPSGKTDPRHNRRPSQIPQEKKNAMLAALRSLSDVCDGARDQDGCGFNGVDSKFGKSLAAQENLSDRQYNTARRMISKYHRQIDDNVKKILGISY